MQSHWSEVLTRHIAQYHIIFLSPLLPLLYIGITCIPLLQLPPALNRAYLFAQKSPCRSHFCERQRPILQQRIRHRLINAVCILLYALIYNLHQHLRKRSSFAQSGVQYDILQNVPQDFFPVWGDKTTPLF